MAKKKKQTEPTDLERLLRAEGRYWNGEIGRRQLHEVAESIRNPKKEDKNEKD